MARLPEPDPAGLPADLETFLADLPPDPMVKMLSHSVGTVRPYIAFARTLFSSLALPARSRELVVLTVAVATDCDFVLGQHESMSAEAGVDRQTFGLIRRKDFASTELSRHDRALITFAAAVIAGPRVPDHLFALIREFLTDREVTEVLTVCGYYWSFARIATVLEVELTRVYSTASIIDSQ